jgi:hypothetical protein
VTPIKKTLHRADNGGKPIVAITGIKEEPMKIRVLSVLTSLLLTCAVGTSATARIAPYVRLDYGGNQLRMTDGNIAVQEIETSLKEAGYPADFPKIGAGFGPTASVGLWIFPSFRLGATYSYLRAFPRNSVYVEDEFYYSDDLDFLMREIGVEAAVRIKRLQGLTVGASVAQGRAQLIEGVNVVDPYGWLYEHATAQRTKMTYGGYVGLDQTNAAGVVGFIRLGYQYRDMGHMPSEWTQSDGTDTAHGTGQTVWLDYSGIYFKVGVGYDFVH